jgi:hypothetical protein
MEEGYNLWEEYVSKCMALQKDFPEMKQVKYEDFLAQPKEMLKEIAQFCQLNFTEKDIEEQVKSVKSDRSFAFVKNPDAIDVYLKIKNQPLMQLLQYDKIIT